jgi:hypothetical protein
MKYSDLVSNKLELGIDSTQTKFAKNFSLEFGEFLRWNTGTESIEDTYSGVRQWSKNQFPHVEYGKQIPSSDKNDAFQTEDQLYQWISQDSGSFLFLIGSVGAGKTSFIKYFFNNYISKQDDSRNHKILWLSIDLGEALLGCTPDTLEKIIDKKLDYEIRKKFKYLDEDPHVFAIWEDYKPLGTSIQSQMMNLLGKEEYDRKRLELVLSFRQNLSEFNTARLRYLAKDAWRVVMAVDSIDRHPKKEQEIIFRILRHKHNWAETGNKIKIIVALRKYLFRESLESSYYETTILHLSPPLISEVIRSRLQILANGIEKKGLKSMQGLGFSWSLSENTIRKLIDAIGEGLLTPHILNSLMSLSNGNIRTTLIFVSRFLSSAFVSWEELLIYANETKKAHHRLIPTWWKVLSGVMVGPGSTYIEEESPILNFFGLSRVKDNFDFLIRIQALDIFLLKEKMSRQEYITMLEHLGYSEVKAEECLTLFLSSALLIEVSDSLSLTKCGIFYRDSLIKSLAYLRLASLDTELPSEYFPNAEIKNIFTLETGIELVLGLLKHIVWAESQQVSFLANSYKGLDLYYKLYQKKPMPIASSIALSITTEIKSIMFGLPQHRKSLIENSLKPLMEQLPFFPPQ